MEHFRKIDGYIVLGIPQAPAGKATHPGGQLTAANGLVDYFARNGVRYEVLNTLATTYPPVPLWVKLFQSVGRIYNGWRHATNANCRGYLAFSNFGLSFYERCVICLIFRLYHKPSLIFFRSTEILGQRTSVCKRKVLSALMSIPSVLVSQGSLLAKELNDFGVRKVEIVPNWLPPGYAIAQKAVAHPVDGVVNFVFVGWLEKAKGVLELLEAAKLLKPLANRFHVYLAGNGTLERFVADEISKGQLTNVHQLGWLDKAEVRHLFDRAHVFVLPSHTEGFPNVLLEAMSHGLPVIATRVGAIPDVIKQDDNGMLINVSDPAGIAACMGRYINEKGLISNHSRSAIETVARAHRSDANCEKLMNALIASN